MNSTTVRREKTVPYVKNKKRFVQIEVHRKDWPNGVFFNKTPYLQMFCATGTRIKLLVHWFLVLISTYEISPRILNGHCQSDENTTKQIR
jgi:hypothetical protein